MDPYVLDVPFLVRWLLVHGIILRTRPRHSARLYKEIWTPQGSPLTVISEKQRSSLSEQTGLPAALGFRYGTPSIKEGLEALLEQGCDTIIGLLFFLNTVWQPQNRFWFNWKRIPGEPPVPISSKLFLLSGTIRPT